MSPILIVEDDEAIRECLTEVLSLEGYEVVTARNGAEGLVALKRHRPALVLLDLMMPVMTGWEFLEVTRADPELSLIPVVAMSAGSIEPSPKPTAFLKKPFSIDELLLIAMQHAGVVQEQMAC